MANSGNGAAAAAVVSRVLGTTNGGICLNKGVNGTLVPRLRAVDRSSCTVIRLSSFRLLAVKGVVGGPSVSIIAGVRVARRSRRADLSRCISTGHGVLVCRDPRSGAILGTSYSCSVNNEICRSVHFSIENELCRFSVGRPIGGNACVTRGNSVVCSRGNYGAIIVGGGSVVVPNVRGIRGCYATVSTI